MIVITDAGIRYVNKRGKLVLVTDLLDISQEELDALPAWERYCVLSELARQGNELKGG